jgi:hypothetical protein
MAKTHTGVQWQSMAFNIDCREAAPLRNFPKQIEESEIHTSVTTFNEGEIIAVENKT